MKKLPTTMINTVVGSFLLNEIKVSPDNRPKTPFKEQILTLMS